MYFKEYANSSIKTASVKVQITLLGTEASVIVIIITNIACKQDKQEGWQADSRALVAMYEGKKKLCRQMSTLHGYVGLGKLALPKARSSQMKPVVGPCTSRLLNTHKEQTQG